MIMSARLTALRLESKLLGPDGPESPDAPYCIHLTLICLIDKHEANVLQFLLPKNIWLLKKSINPTFQLYEDWQCTHSLLATKLSFVLGKKEKNIQ